MSDFTPDYRGTLEKKNNEDADDWSDIDAVVSALQGLADAGLEALADAVKDTSPEPPDCPNLNGSSQLANRERSDAQSLLAASWGSSGEHRP